MQRCHRFEILRKYHALGTPVRYFPVAIRESPWLAQQCAAGSILSASGSSGADGLVTGHAYSILQARPRRRSSPTPFTPLPKKVRKVNDGFMGIGGKDALSAK